MRTVNEQPPPLAGPGGHPPAAPHARMAAGFAEAVLGPRMTYFARPLAARWGVSVLEAAAAAGLVRPEAIAQALAERLGATFSTLEGLAPELAADPRRWREFLSRGAAPVVLGQGVKALLIGLRPAEAERLAADPAAARRRGLPLVVTTPERFGAFLRGAAAAPWTEEAILVLKTGEPEASAGDALSMRRAGRRIAGVLAALAAALLIGSPLGAAIVGVLIGAGVLAWAALRFGATLAQPQPLRRRALAEAHLPRYTVIATLYREEAVAAQLLAALARLDYPRARLDILLVLEEDDPATAAALRAAGLPPNAEIVVLPPGGPRTKPKALMMALPLARGDLVVVYDAEDRPGPGQLREAAETFAAAGLRLGCVQAPLAIANAGQSWLTRIFAAEYDALFRVLLPALARFGLPMPLGGTSNHFRRAALTQSLGWDPYNVTEDADLGLRLARNGWQVATISTPTEEEAPVGLEAWIRQRSRWYKGWLQTLAVLFRRPLDTARALGAAGCACALVMLAGSAGTALVHLICLAAIAAGMAFHGLGPTQITAAAVIAVDYLCLCAYLLAGLRRAKRLHLAPFALVSPLLWVPAGFAALRALWELQHRPFHWLKTDHHGLPEDAPADPFADLAIQIDRLVCLSRQALASGDHAAEAAYDVLGRTRSHLVKIGAPPPLLALIDAHRAELAVTAEGGLRRPDRTPPARSGSASSNIRRSP